MNNEFEAYLKIVSFLALILGPIGLLVVGYTYWRDFNLYPNLPHKMIIGLEGFFLAGTIFIFFFIKRKGWDFWNKSKN